jgi:hypothetical protein
MQSTAKSGNFQCSVVEVTVAVVQGAKTAAGHQRVITWGMGAKRTSSAAGGPKGERSEANPAGSQQSCGSFSHGDR